MIFCLQKLESDKSTGELKAYPLDDRIPVIIELENEIKIIKNSKIKI